MNPGKSKQVLRFMGATSKSFMFMGAKEQVLKVQIGAKVQGLQILAGQILKIANWGENRL
jgi:hypothetical protein